MAATASAPKAEAKLLSRVMPVTLSRFWMEAGIPTCSTPTTMGRRKQNLRGSMQTLVVCRRRYSRTKKYRQATQLDRKVAKPAPAAPIPKPQGMMKTGSSTMFSRQPLMVPMLACMVEPSARTR